MAEEVFGGSLSDAEDSSQTHPLVATIKFILLVYPYATVSRKPKRRRMRQKKTCTTEKDDERYLNQMGQQLPVNTGMWTILSTSTSY